MYRVLITDDEKIEREGIKFLLAQEEGEYEIHEAANGRQALNVLRSEEIDFLLTDIKMPHMDGLELASKVREEYPKAQPVSYWKNTSDNAIIRSFIDFAGNSITDKMETLLSGGYILQDIDENLTYDYLHSSESNLWSILYMTGYLTEARISEGKTAFSPDTKALKIPNAEIREIFETTVMKWFADSVKKWN